MATQYLTKNDLTEAFNTFGDNFLPLILNSVQDMIRVESRSLRGYVDDRFDVQDMKLEQRLYVLKHELKSELKAELLLEIPAIIMPLIEQMIADSTEQVLLAVSEVTNNHEGRIYSLEKTVYT
jgi:hypothetical protein